MGHQRPNTDGPGFDQPVAPGGYVWWYVDALSDDGQHGLTIIAFIGSVFSPYYAWARQRAPGGAADPLNHCSINVALYGEGPNRWAMTERGRTRIDRGARHFSVGPSGLHWDGRTLTIHLDEIAAPLPRAVQGRVRVTPHAMTTQEFAIDHQDRHHWWPMAPTAEVSVALNKPALSWHGTGYLDRNRGDEPLEAGFQEWDWARAPLPSGGTAITYDTFRRDGSDHALSLLVRKDGGIERFDNAVLNDLPSTSIWRIRRKGRADAGHRACVSKTLEDTPFYARSLVETHLAGEPVRAMHESLSLTRFDTRIVRLMLPFRMPRIRA
ncbi:carotenoid 1,2-hydratase [Rhodobaculum claviforme]|uniref:Carotenoid 1,2-hydratase n=2 Tax=Alphaproteobacteria TaxID=28211 RepID=A0A934TKR3_9RHOB|nr:MULTISPECIES: carotenoid 1,2-hydratase [Alphaproteobacteria]MBK1696355.1 carotenoid 1,2-hydratase [Rhodovibrio salinarum]MBK5927354.1 carotenoid 1,2-hydratase [Rhodobaculum claviforme]